MRMFDILSPYYPRMKYSEGSYGIEIETETMGEFAYPEGFLKETLDELGDPSGVWENPIEDWRAVEDGSLRNYGVEFVLDRPMSYEEALDALDRFGDATASVDFLKNAPATSVHVHINVQNWLPITLCNFLTLWTLVENCMIEISGEDRRSNTFCRPIRTAQVILDQYQGIILKLAEQDVFGLYHDEQSAKYAALNISPLTTLGSIEVRCMRGTTDVKVIKDWLSLINRLVEQAKTFETPEDVMESLKEDGPVDFLFTVLGDIEITEETINLLLRNQKFAADLAYETLEDWGEFEKDWAEHFEMLEGMIAYLIKAKRVGKVTNPRQTALDHLRYDFGHWKKLYLHSLEDPLAKVEVKSKSKVAFQKLIDDLPQHPSAYIIDDILNTLEPNEGPF